MGFSPEPFPTRDIRVGVKGALKYADRFSAVGSGVMNDSSDNNDIDGTASFGLIEIVSLLSNNNNHNESRETVLLAGKLPHPIHLNQDEDEIDFEIEDNILCSDDGWYQRARRSQKRRRMRQTRNDHPAQGGPDGRHGSVVGSSVINGGGLSQNRRFGHSREEEGGEQGRC